MGSPRFAVDAEATDYTGVAVFRRGFPQLASTDGMRRAVSDAMRYRLLV